MIISILAAAAVAAAPAPTVTTRVYAGPQGATVSPPEEIGVCTGGTPATPVDVCRLKNGRVYLRLEVPPCTTKEADAAGRCIEWEVRPDVRYLIPPRPSAAK